MSKSQEFRPSAEQTLKDILSMNKEQISAAVDVILKTKKKTGISPLTIRKTLLEAGFDKTNAKAISLLIFNLSLTDEPQTADWFSDFIKLKFPNDVEGINELINLIKPIIDEVIKYAEFNKITTFGIPHLSEMDFMTDYRILSVNNKRELIPIVLCKMVIHEHIREESEDAPVDRAFTFQFSPEALDSLIAELESFKNKLQGDLDFLSILGDKT